MLMHCDGCGALVNAEWQGSFTRSTGPGVGELEERFILANALDAEDHFSAPKERENGPGSEQDDWRDPRQLYPVSEAVSHAYPAGIRSAFTEALACYRAKGYTATAIMCRKTMEGLADAHGVQERNLGKALRQLQAQNVIEGRLVEWAEELRFSGNEAAHDVNVVISPAEARDIVDFTKALLEYVHTFRLRFEEFRARREGRRGAATTAPAVRPS
jgi:hypothetical protein